MKTPLAWKNLTHNKVRTAIGVAGVGFAVILIFMQMGFKGAIKKTATQIYDALDFDSDAAFAGLPASDRAAGFPSFSSLSGCLATGGCQSSAVLLGPERMAGSNLD